MGEIYKGFLVSCWVFAVHIGMGRVSGIGVNWGTQASHSLPPATIVTMVRENGFQNLKLFDADSFVLKTLANSGIQVMVGIPNDMLASLATNVQAAENWVAQNVSSHISSNGVDIRYVAVGNEPLLPENNGTYDATTLPALQNIQAALIKAGLSTKVKATIPLNANVYSTSTGLPSGGDFRAELHDLMLNIVKFLSDNGAPFVVNIYPFISLYNDPHFPPNYAFFDNTETSVNDGGTIYTNVFDANYDTLIWALRKSGYENLPVIVGEVGWPTDGDQRANIANARRFNQGFLNRINRGTPMRPGALDAYLFGLIDEDRKSIQPGNFERHWGLFYYDGKPKYPLSLNSNQNHLVAAKDVSYLPKKWCILSPSASLDDPNVASSLSYACANADCTSLGYGTSCGNLDARQNVSYAFNNYYQANNQLDRACQFPNVSMITTKDPSTETCKFNIMFQLHSGVRRTKFLPFYASLVIIWCSAYL